MGHPDGIFRLNWVDKSLLNPNGIQSTLRGNPWQEGRGFTLDTSLERVFGQGATRLAIEFEGGSGGKSESDSSSDSEVDVTAVSTPSRDEIGKKRLRGFKEFGNLSGISGKATHEMSSEGDSTEDENEVKKPRIAGDQDDGSDTIGDPLSTEAVVENGEAEDSVVELLEGVPLGVPGPSASGGDGELSSEGTQ